MQTRNQLIDEDLRNFFGPRRRHQTAEDEMRLMMDMGFGEYLVDQNIITRGQLFEALQLQDRNPYVRLGECLAALGYMTYPDVEDNVSRWRDE